MRRSVCFVKRLQLHFKGNVFSQALCLGDVDNDGRNECAIGNVEGCLAVFKKAKHDKPWRVCNDLGTIACVGVGDLCGIGKNVLVSISSEGQCHIFYLEKDFEDDRGDMKPVCTQRIPANVRALLLADIAGDGVCHLAVGHTDRVVRVYEWVKGKLLDDTSGFIAGSLSMIKKWSLEAQVGSLSVTEIKGGPPLLTVSQPGGNFIHLAASEIPQLSQNKSGHSLSEECDKEQSQPINIERCLSTPSDPDIAFASSPRGTLLSGSSASRVATEVLGCIHSHIENEDESLTALSTLDGSLQLYCGQKLLWELRVNHQLFSLAKLDITRDGNDEVVTCAWDGRVYIVDSERNVVTYQFEENVAAFAAGNYCIDGSDEPCMVFATFSNRLFIYYDVVLPSIKATSFDIMPLIEDSELLSGIEKGLLTPKKLVSWCIYGDPANPKEILDKFKK
eukprot:m.154099 g.154099  ORF g.154099 m.154099 type:complete len:448 (+) comp38632_c0_seq2:116-1459(+)